MMMAALSTAIATVPRWRSSPRSLSVLLVLATIVCSPFGGGVCLGFSPSTASGVLSPPRRVVPSRSRRTPHHAAGPNMVLAGQQQSRVILTGRSMLNSSTANIVCSASGLIILIGYHVLLQRKEQAAARSGNKATTSWRVRQAATRVAWANFVHSTEGWLYSIQTLRNAITANTFLATTVLTLLTVVSGKLWQMNSSGSSGVFAIRVVKRFQFASVALCMLLSAFEFLQSARLMTHAGFMFPVVPKEDVSDIMRKSSVAQWLGLRWLYSSVAMLVWTVVDSAVPFLVVAMALTLFFRQIDQ